MLRKSCFVCILFALFVGDSFAQNPGTGQYPLGSFDVKGFDSINLGNLNVHFAIPIVSKTGRGLPFTYLLAYDGLVWSSNTSAGSGYWQPDGNFGFYGQLGEAFQGYISYRDYTQKCFIDPPSWFWADHQTNFVYYDQFGVGHDLNYSYNACTDGLPYSGDGSTSDGSGIWFDGTWIHLRNGTKILPPVDTASGHGTITDANGNTITNNGNGTFVDTTGTTELTIAGAGSPSSPLTFTYPVALQADSATSAKVTVYYRSYTVQTNFGCSGITEYGATVGNLIDHITLADSSSDTYTFTYEPTPGVSGAVTGRLASVTLPTGGVIQYSYSGGCTGGINTDGTPATLKRTTSDGYKVYTRNISQAPVSTTYVADEEGNETDLAFISDTLGHVYETSRSVYQGAKGSGSPLEYRTIAYNGLPSSSQLTSSISQTNVMDEYNGIRPSEIVSTYDANGMQTGSTVEDPSNGNQALTALTTTYNALSEVWSSEVTDPAHSNAVVTSVSNGYDETAPVATSGIPQHNAASGARGNLTTANVWAGYASLSTTYINYDTGAVASITGPTGTTTQYSYDPTQTFVTTTTLPTASSGAQISTSGTFNATAGIQASATGPNAGQVTTYAQYDRLLRLTQVTSPSPDNGQVTETYTPNQISVITKMSPTQSTDQETFLDTYGRPKRVAIANGSGWYLTDSCYNADGLLQYQSTPYFSSSENPSSMTCSISTGNQYTYDAVGRKTHVSHADGSSMTLTYNGRATESASSSGVSRITQYDLLGRISSVCEISSNDTMPGSGSPQSCGADITGTGFITAYAYNLSAHTTTVTQGEQQRVFQTDAVGRAIQTNEPEAGITNYSYAFNSTGWVVTRTRPEANQTSASVLTTTTTQYDQLGRILSVTYTDGTPTKTFAYDQTPSGDSIPNLGGYLKGQLVSISATSGSTKLHQRNYSYDIMGRVNETAECLPGWCGQSSHDVYRWYGYNSASQMTTETYASAGDGGTPVSLYYGYNSAGQLTSMTGGQNNATSSPNIYSVQAIGPSGPTLAQFGNGVYAPYQYDSVGRLQGGWACSGSTQPECTGGTQYYGYNANYSGSLLASMVDTIQNEASYLSYDEFGRLTKQTYSHGGNDTSLSWIYDRWGNRTQQNVTQGSGPQPSYLYNTATNQIIGDSYDAGGNVRSDNYQSFTYDAENNMISEGGEDQWSGTFVYDALNERVEVSTNHGTELYGFDINGRRSTAWNNSTGVLDSVQYYAGRPVAYWLAADGNIHFEHQDWLGTERVRTTKAGVLEGSYTSLPFGDAFSASGTDTNIGHFAQLDHDMSASSGLEHATFREYNSTRGRWLNPDSYLGSYNEGNPQSFNRYTYVGNNPLTATDASGLMMNLNINDPGIGVEAQEADAAAWNADAWFNGKVGPSEGNYGNPFNDPLANPNNPIYNPSQIIDDGGQTDNGVVQTQVTIDCTGDFISGFQCTVGSPSTSYEENVFAGAFMNALSNSSGNYPTRMFGTHWCGPGGAGPTVNQLDAACQAHDGCYDRGYNGKAFTPLSNWDPFQSPGRVQALQQCNQNLCNAAAQTNDPGSIRVILFFTSVPVGACYSIP